jgi:hypothetical protein
VRLRCGDAHQKKKKPRSAVPALPARDHFRANGFVRGRSGLLDSPALQANRDDAFRAILDVRVVGFAHCDVSERAFRYDSCPPWGVTEGNRELASGQDSFRNGRSRRKANARTRDVGREIAMKLRNGKLKSGRRGAPRPRRTTPEVEHEAGVPVRAGLVADRLTQPPLFLAARFPLPSSTAVPISQNWQSVSPGSQVSKNASPRRAGRASVSHTTRYKCVTTVCSSADTSLGRDLLASVTTACIGSLTTTLRSVDVVTAVRKRQ